MPPTLGNGKKISELFFKRETQNSNVFVCMCGTKRKKTASSYQNLVSHVVSAHPNYAELLKSKNPHEQIYMEQFFNTSKSTSTYGWFDMIVNAFLPFSYVEHPIIKNHVRHDNMSLSSFMKYSKMLTEEVEKKISLELPSKFALVLDGWTCDSTHYLAMFASFKVIRNAEHSVRLLCFSPLSDECRLDSS